MLLLKKQSKINNPIAQNEKFWLSIVVSRVKQLNNFFRNNSFKIQISLTLDRIIETFRTCITADVLYSCVYMPKDIQEIGVVLKFYCWHVFCDIENV